MHTTKTRTIAILGAIVTGTAGLAISVPAQADVARTRVSYVDLDVTSQDGRRMLAGRIDHAADQVCHSDDPADRAAVAECRARALDHAYADLAAKGVTLR